jgi:hypothetical protein
MSDEAETTAQDTPRAITAPPNRADWFQAMEDRCAEEGYFEPVGDRHWAWFHDDGPNLIVSFETLESVLAREGRLSFGHSVAAARGWSHLCLISDGETWFRDDRVYRYFDRLVDEGFFEDFDNVLFYGSASGAHAACAFAVCAPGAVVMAVQPRATLDPAVTGWDDRFARLRRLDFSSRYGFGPDMIEGAAAVWLIYDPATKADLIHAALYRGSHVHHLRARFAGNRLEDALTTMGILPRLMTEACEGTLTPQVFTRLWRRRLRNLPFLKELLARTEAAQSQRRLWVLCRALNSRVNLPRARRLFGRLQPLYATAADRAEAGDWAGD